MKTIVTLLDLSDMTPNAMEHTERMAKSLRAKVVLMHVLPEDTTPAKARKEPSPPKRDASIEADYHRLTSLADYLRQTSVKVEVEQLVDADIRLTRDECEVWKPDLIIVGSKSDSPVCHWFTDSPDASAVTPAHCPVVVVPEKQGSQAAWDRWPFDSAA
jgi:nucleotide-binding universal stress UspA family protein